MYKISYFCACSLVDSTNFEQNNAGCFTYIANDGYVATKFMLPRGTSVPICVFLTQFTDE